MKNGIKYEFAAMPWQQCWYFVSLPEEMANEIRGNLKFMEEGKSVFGFNGVITNGKCGLLSEG